MKIEIDDDYVIKNRRMLESEIWCVLYCIALYIITSYGIFCFAMVLYGTRSLRALRAPTSSWRLFSPPGIPVHWGGTLSNIFLVKF